MKALLRNSLIWRGACLHASDIIWLGHWKQQSQMRFTDTISKVIYISRIPYFTPRLSSQSGWSLGTVFHLSWPLSPFCNPYIQDWKLQSTWICSELATMKEILGDTENSCHVPAIINCQINSTIFHFNHSPLLLDLKSYLKWKGAFKIKNVLWGSQL